MGSDAESTCIWNLGGQIGGQMKIGTGKTQSLLGIFGGDGGESNSPSRVRAS